MSKVPHDNKFAGLETFTACISHKTAVVFLFQFAKVLCQLVA